jgi:hypothetical protein
MVEKLRCIDRRLFQQFVGQGANGVLVLRIELPGPAPAFNGLSLSVKGIQSESPRNTTLGEPSGRQLPGRFCQGRRDPDAPNIPWPVSQELCHALPSPTQGSWCVFLSEGLLNRLLGVLIFPCCCHLRMLFRCSRSGFLPSSSSERLHCQECHGFFRLVGTSPFLLPAHLRFRGSLARSALANHRPVLSAPNPNSAVLAAGHRQPSITRKSNRPDRHPIAIQPPQQFARLRVP